MTTLESPAFPEWEATPSVEPDAPASAEAVRDPDWIFAHLRDALASEHPKAMAELVLGDVSLYTSEAEQSVTAITERSSLPALRWHRRYGPVSQLRDTNGLARYMREVSALISEWEHNDPVPVAQQWATELRLREAPDPSDGTRAWSGVIDGWHVKVWVITDQAAFDAR
ncbi:hypothetical protein OG874_00715 [Nocardia sp. NBC_00565]|uniref:hypothetical protein n=1 Tax=Nocardia sp. NBC_00565 TaxID=2975993 RepID=UPI002E82260A|nr:hypothetical protein [Nocardia sp. NBC_00565]WUC03778.1 hypothetical protein OG874_00715 [Nocardia sp. NBC_00565]